MPFPYARLIVGTRQCRFLISGYRGDGSAVSLRQINCRETALPSPDFLVRYRGHGSAVSLRQINCRDTTMLCPDFGL